MDSAATEPEGTGEGAAPRISLGEGRALVPVPPAAPEAGASSGLSRSHGIVAAGAAAVLGLGIAAGAAFFPRPQTATMAQAAPVADPTAEALSRVQGEVRALKASLDGLRASAEDARQADTVRALKKSVDLLKGDLEGVKSASAGAVGQLGAKIDRLDRDPGPKLAEIAARLDKLDREPDARIAQVAGQITARLDRIERQVASGDATGSVPAGAAAGAQVKPPPPRAAAASPTGPSAAAVLAVPPARPDAPARPEAPRAEPAPARPDAPRQEAARPATLDGWLLRDVYGGVALVEGRAGGLREVAPGEYVPGVGEIRSIERRGRGWVVVTSRGIIQADNRW